MIENNRTKTEAIQKAREKGALYNPDYITMDILATNFSYKQVLISQIKNHVNNMTNKKSRNFIHIIPNI